MFPAVLLPLLAATILAVAVTTVHRRLPPKLSTRMLVVSMAAVVGAALPTLWIVSFSYLSHLPVLGDGFEWCARVFGVHEQVPHWVGIPAAFVAWLGVVRATRVLRLHRRLRHDGPGFVEIAGHESAFAFTLPGRGGHVVLSQGLIDLLDDQEQSVVLAHEQTHARYRHDRYLLIGQLAAASTLLLRPLASRLRFSIERWADEAAVAAHSGDRLLVANTLGKVALNTLTPAGALSFAGLGVTARVAALLAPQAPQPRWSTVVAMWSAIAATTVLAGFQLHHLARLVTALCPG